MKLSIRHVNKLIGKYAVLQIFCLLAFVQA